MDLISMGVQACPFLRSITKDTSLDLAKEASGSCATKDRAQGQCPAQRGPIFCDELNFESTFRLFHGSGGVVPLSRFSEQPAKSEAPKARDQACPRLPAADSSQTAPHPLAASAATISISAFGGGAPNPFSWDGFMAARNKQKTPEVPKPGRPEAARSSRRPEASTGGQNPTSKSDALKSRGEIGSRLKPQEARARGKPAKATAAPEAPAQQQHVAGEPVDAKEWLSTSNCPVAKMHRALMELAPAAAELLRNPQNMKLTCPAPIIAARAALAKTPPIRQLRPQPLNAKLLAVGGSTLLVNVPLGMWREHVEKFSAEWFVAVHAAVPFVAMLRKAVLIPKHAMVLTILAAILGQVIGSRGERYRVRQKVTTAQQHPEGSVLGGQPSVRATAVQQPVRGPAEGRRVERTQTDVQLVDPEAPAAGCAAGPGILDLFSGRAEEMGWTPSRVKGRGVSGKTCQSSWKLPRANGLGLEGRATWVH